MANRREEERARLREAREEREKEHTSSERKRLLLAYIGAGAIAVAIVAAIVVVAISSGGGDGGASHINGPSGSTNGIQPDDRSGVAPPALKVSSLKKSAKEAGDLRLHLKDEGHEHIPPGSASPEYKTNPPTSGNHVDPPFQQADGAYSEQPLPIDMVHSLEHGRMEIQYSPDLAEEDQLALKGLYDTMYGGTLLFPNEGMPYAVAATTWTNLLGCKQYKGAITLDAIRDFGKATWGIYGGEPAEEFPLAGPTPKEPKS